MTKKQRIIELRAQGKTFQQISDELNVCRSYACRVCKGKEREHPRKRVADAPAALTEEELAVKFGAIEIGAVTEVQIAVKLTLLGFDVWTPFVERRRSDLGVFVSGRLLRVQAKTAGYEIRTKRFRACLTTKGSKKKASRYSPGDIDFFIVKCANVEEYYVLPAQVGVDVSFVNLYPHREKLLEREGGYEKYRNAFDLLRGG